MIEIFWKIINKFKSIEEIKQYLEQKNLVEIINFQKSLNYLLAKSYKAKLWVAAYIILDGASDDSFEYFRAWLITKGEYFFNETLLDPDTLVEIDIIEDIEEIGQELLRITFDILNERNEDTTVLKNIYEKYPEIYNELDKIDFDNIEQISKTLPKLSAKYLQS